MPYTFTLTALIPASPQQIYDTWLDSRGHSAMTGAKAVQSAKVGGAVSAWDDYITGRNLHLEPNKRIVQTWRSAQFTDADGDSIVTLTLTRVAGGTRITLNHANVPDGHTSYEESGWKEHYFTPMQRYFMTMTSVAEIIARAKEGAKKFRRRTTVRSAAKQAAAKKKRKTAAKKATAGRGADAKSRKSVKRKKPAKRAGRKAKQQA